MRRQSVILAVLIALVLLGGQTYAQTVLSFGKLYGPRHGSFSFSLSIFDPAPVYYQPVVVMPPPTPVYYQPVVVMPPPAPVYVYPTYVPAPVCPAPVVIERPVWVQTPVMVRHGPVMPGYYPPRSGYSTYYQGQQIIRQGHWVYQPMTSWDGVVRYRTIYVND